MVGSPSTYWLAGVIGLVLVSILTKVTLSPWALASSSMIGATCLHGPHQSAQKSTITGLSDWSTTSEKVASVTSAPAPITFPLLAVETPSCKRVWDRPLTLGSAGRAGEQRLVLGQQHVAAGVVQVGQVALRVQRPRAPGPGGGDRLPVGVVDQVATGEHAGQVGPGGLAVGDDVALAVQVDLAVDQLRAGVVTDGDEQTGDRQLALLTR